MNQHEFSITLPSNNSLQYFPNNTTTNFSTRLPREVELSGKWLVGISEVHIPCTTLHLRKQDTILSSSTDLEKFYFQHGTYDSIFNLVQAINEALYDYHRKEVCEKLFYEEKGGFITRRLYKSNDIRHECKTATFSESVKRILGFECDFSRSRHGLIQIGDQPASLARALPDQLFFYSNLCEPSIVGDTYAPLLRIVNLDAKEFNFGCTIVKRFSSVNFIPLLTNRFQIIDIDIRNQLGEPIPFEFGTLTIQLQFKRDY